MGNRAMEFFASRGVQSNCNVVSGFINTDKFFSTSAAKEFDLILVARLSPVKCVDLFLRIVQQLKEEIPEISAVVVGGGPLLGELKEMAAQLAIKRNVVFAGQQADVENWLRRAKVFLLTSSSEGLALAMMEAMMCGLPPVVPWVGDLDNLVETGVNGFLVSGREPQDFTPVIQELLLSDKKWSRFSKAAVASAQKYRLDSVAGLWDRILTDLKKIDVRGCRE